MGSQLILVHDLLLLLKVELINSHPFFVGINIGPEVGLLAALVLPVPLLLADLALVQLLVLVTFLLVLVLLVLADVLLELAPLRGLLGLAAAPPHLAAPLGPMRAAGPVEVLALLVLLLT